MVVNENRESASILGSHKQYEKIFKLRSYLGMDIPRLSNGKEICLKLHGKKRCDKECRSAISHVSNLNSNERQAWCKFLHETIKSLHIINSILTLWIINSYTATIEKAQYKISLFLRKKLDFSRHSISSYTLHANSS